jgi:Alanine dehydrogenase/PNT, C-terminal domain
MDWDPEVDAPATIAVIGGGPVGIEAAIYARFLGYFVSIFEERRVAHRMLDWHERPLAVPVSQCTTPLGHAAILAQNPDIVRRSAEDFFTGKSYAEEYLLPLAKTDLLFDDIHFLSPVHDVSRRCLLATDDVAAQERANDEFRILVDGTSRYCD